MAAVRQIHPGLRVEVGCYDELNPALLSGATLSKFNHILLNSRSRFVKLRYNTSRESIAQIAEANALLCSHSKAQFANIGSTKHCSTRLSIEAPSQNICLLESRVPSRRRDKRPFAIP